MYPVLIRAAFLLLGAAQPAADESFRKGIELFDAARTYAAERPTDRDEIARRYLGAAESFVAAWKAGAATTEVFTNAANSYYFGGKVGEAVLYYRRALSLDPSNSRARQALEHIRVGLPIRRPEVGAAASIVKSLFFWHEGLPFRTRRAAFLALFPAAFAALAASIFRRRPFRLIGWILLAAALLLFGSLLADGLGSSLRQEAVVLTQVEGRRGDGMTYSPSHSRPFPPGTEVAIQSVRQPTDGGKGEAWLLVRLLDGKESWIQEGAVERVLP